MEAAHTEQEAARAADAWRSAAAVQAHAARAMQLGDVLGLDPNDDVVPDDGPNDGRTMRRTRNREAVIVALLDLVRDGEMEPSVADIADRAHVSHRSVFRYFDDLNDLVRTAIDYEVRRSLPLAVISDIGVGSLERRADALVDARLTLYEETYNVNRVARYRSIAIPAIDDGLVVISDLTRTQMRKHFAAELAERDHARAEFVLDASMVLTGFEAYDVHRRVFQHNTERIRLVWNAALIALFRT